MDAHKKAFYVEFQNPCIACVVLSTTTDKPVYPLYCKVGSFSYPAGVAVVDKLLFQKLVYFPDYQVVDYSVSEIGGENFPLYRFIYNKCQGRAGNIPAFTNFTVEPQQVFFVVDFKGDCGRRFSLVFSAGLIGFKEFFQVNRLLREKFQLPAHGRPL